MDVGSAGSGSLRRPARSRTRSKPRSWVSRSFDSAELATPAFVGRRSWSACSATTTRAGLRGHSATVRAARPAVQPVAAHFALLIKSLSADAAKSDAQGNDLGLTCGTYLPTGKLALQDASAVRPTSLPRQVEPAKL